MERIEIMVRLACASFRMNGGVGQVANEKDVGNWADQLISEDRRRTEASKPCDHLSYRRVSSESGGRWVCNGCGETITRPIDNASNTPAELAPLVVEESKYGGWNIHTPNRTHYFSINGWNDYKGMARSTKETGCFYSEEAAKAYVADAELTRPDRPAKEAKPTDPIIESNVRTLRERAAAGLQTYGTDLTRKDLTRDQWLEHLLHELLDAANYVTRIRMEEGKP